MVDAPESCSRLSGVTSEEDAEARRRVIVELAARLIVEEGPHGLSLRRLSREAGGSTQLVYTLFGGKQGLADALYAEGFRRLGEAGRQALAAAPPPGDPERLVVIGHSYRRFALAEPALFSVMFGRAVPGFTPTRRTRQDSRAATFGHVVSTVQECLDAGTLVGPPAEDLARMCWATVHGLASLEVAGLLGPEDVDAFADAALRVPVDAHRPSALLDRVDGSA